MSDVHTGASMPLRSGIRGYTELLDPDFDDSDGYVDVLTSELINLGSISRGIDVVPSFSNYEHVRPPKGESVLLSIRTDRLRKKLSAETMSSAQAREWFKRAIISAEMSRGSYRSGEFLRASQRFNEIRTRGSWNRLVDAMASLLVWNKWDEL